MAFLVGFFCYQQNREGCKEERVYLIPLTTSQIGNSSAKATYSNWFQSPSRFPFRIKVCSASYYRQIHITILHTIKARKVKVLSAFADFKGGCSFTFRCIYLIISSLLMLTYQRCIRNSWKSINLPIKKYIKTYKYRLI